MLKETVAYHSRKSLKEASTGGDKERRKLLKQIQHQIYIDNLITDCTSQEEIIQLYQIGKETFGNASFEIPMSGTNTPEFQKMITKEGLAGNQTQKALVFTWQILEEEQKISFSIRILDNEPVTRRTILARLV